MVEVSELVRNQMGIGDQPDEPADDRSDDEFTAADDVPIALDG